ncbi:hypothetical protein CHUAL_006525 [Chamberlinius hualienensis]
MVSRQPERYIPDVRDVFQRQSSNGQSRQRNSVEICRSYRDEHSDEEHYDYNNGRTTKSSRGNGGVNVGGGGGVHQLRNNNNEHSSGRNNDFSSKALTEKDLKHIERHLSMKKTIRKQLSRHLSKAFVESEADATPASNKNERSNYNNNPNNLSTPANYSLTFNKSNVTKSESNFLDLLKEAGGNNIDGSGADSGHCSPTTEIDRTRMEKQWYTNRVNSSSCNPSMSSRNNNVSASASSALDANDTKKSNFWKKLTVRAKSKR